MTVDQVFIIKKLQNLDEMLVAYSAVTRMPFATCDEESFNDQVWIFTDQDKMKAFAEKYKEEKETDSSGEGAEKGCINVLYESVFHGNQRSGILRWRPGK